MADERRETVEAYLSDLIDEINYARKLGLPIGDPPKEWHRTVAGRAAIGVAILAMASFLGIDVTAILATLGF